jgi:hypothetical protein
MIETSFNRSRTKWQNRSYGIESLSRLPQDTIFTQNGIWYVMYLNRSGTTSITKAQDLPEELKYEIYQIASHEQKSEYIEKLYNAGFIYKRPAETCKRLEKNLSKNRYRNGYRLF